MIASESSDPSCPPDSDQRRQPFSMCEAQRWSRLSKFPLFFSPLEFPLKHPSEE